MEQVRRLRGNDWTRKVSKCVYFLSLSASIPPPQSKCPSTLINPYTPSPGVSTALLLTCSDLSVTVLTLSGRKIINILEKNPQKDPEAYDDDDVDHMRRVVAYCKRHLAQEDKAKRDPESRSARSLKNWGHDPARA